MLIDALRAEFWRLLHHRSALIWGFIFLPVMTFVSLMAMTLWALSQNMLGGEMAPSASILDMALGTIFTLPGPWLTFFTLIGAANIFGADYRFETWRLSVPRNGRLTLLSAKLMVFLAAVIASILALLLAQTLATLIAALLSGATPTLAMPPVRAEQLALAFGLGLWRILQVALIGLLVVIVTRSIMAGVLVPILMLATEQVLMGMMGFNAGAMNPDWSSVLALPGLAYAILSLGIQSAMMSGAHLPDGVLTKGLVSMGLWTLVPLALALALFQRQTLSRE